MNGLTGSGGGRGALACEEVGRRTRGIARQEQAEHLDGLTLSARTGSPPRVRNAIRTAPLASMRARLRASDPMTTSDRLASPTAAIPEEPETHASAFTQKGAS